MPNNRKTTSLILSLAALALLAGFSGCSGGGPEEKAPASIRIKVADIELAKMPDFKKKNMAGFTISLVPQNGPVQIVYDVSYLAQRTVMDGSAAEAVKAFLSNPPSAAFFSLEFNVETSSKFDGTGNYVVVLGASNDYCKYNDQTPGNYGDGTLYSEGKMFIINDPENTTQKGTRDIYDRMVIPWSDFLMNDDGKGYSAEEIANMFL